MRQFRRVACGLVMLSLLVITLFGLSGCGPKAGGETVASPSKGQVTQYGNGYRFDRNGWVHVHIEGEPRARGFLDGYLKDRPSQPWVVFKAGER